jgi:hypothetical protein
MIDEIVSKISLTLARSRREILTFVMMLGLVAGPLTLPALSVTLAWNPSTSPTVAGYMVYSGADGTNFDSEMDAGDSTTATVTNLAAGSTNYFEVAAYDTNGDFSPPSNLIEYVVPISTNTVTVEVNSGNAGTATGGGTFATGASVTVTASANAGYTFVSWTEDGIVQSTSADYTFTLASNCAFVANFTPNAVIDTLATQVSPANAGSATGGGSFAEGTSVTVTAAATAGYTFVAWTDNGVAQSTSPNYTFTLAGDLDLVANFVTNPIISNPPTNPVTYTVVSVAAKNGSVNPSGALTVTNGGSIAFTAIPASSYQVSQWVLNGTVGQTGGSTYTLHNVTTNDAVTVTFSLNPAVTTTATATVAQAPANTNFTLLVNGNGALTPSRIAKSSLVGGKTYTLSAVAAKGSVFAGWASNGVVVATTAKYTFTVESNVVLQANFIPNPFLPVVGTYHGLFYVTNNATEDSSGSLVASVTSAGVYSAKIRLGTGSYSCSGALSVNGTATKTINRPGLTPLTLELQLDMTNGPLTGTVSDGEWTADLAADADVYSRTNPAPQAGKYTLLIPGSDNATAQPGGNGFGAVIVSELGAVTFSGTLGDGTHVSSTSIVSSEGEWPFYASLYGGTGSILGWLNFTNKNAISGETGWFKLPQANAKLYAAGFTNSAEVIGSAYQYTNGLPVLGFAAGELFLTNGDLSVGITNQVALGSEAQANDQSPGSQSTAKIKFVASSGLFTGSVINPETGKPIPVNGVVLQNQNFGAGLFLGTTESGSVLLSSTQSTQ